MFLQIHMQNKQTKKTPVINYFISRVPGKQLD